MESVPPLLEHLSVIRDREDGNLRRSFKRLHLMEHVVKKSLLF